MQSGNKPIDDGNYLFTPEEREDFLKLEPAAAPYFRRWLGGEEFINGIERWYLWLGQCQPEQLRQLPESMKRVNAVHKFRMESKSIPTNKIAGMPTRFHTEFIADGPFIALPQVSSIRRLYIPIAFLDNSVLCGDKLRVLPNATLYHFGVLSSTMHMVWVRTTTGRLKSDYQYSVLIVYNNFPWPQTATDKQKQAIEDAAQAVLDARAQFPNASLADLYDPLTMPVALTKAHHKLDATVDMAYAKRKFTGDSDRIAFLFELYQQITSPLESKKATRRKRAKT